MLASFEPTITGVCAWNAGDQSIQLVKESIGFGHEYTYYVLLNGHRCRPMPAAHTQNAGKAWYNLLVSLLS